MLPVETFLAVFPSAVAMGNVTLRPLTLYHVTALEMMGVDITLPCDAGNAYTAAWILSQSPLQIRDTITEHAYKSQEILEWMQGIGVGVSEVVESVNTIINSAFTTNVPGGGNNQSSFIGGYGWPLEIAEAICHEYSISFDDAMSIPLSRVFGMIACARVRNGGKAGGPDYYERILISKMKALKKKG